MTRDENYLDICNTVAKNSKCLSRKIGAIIVTSDNSIISTGYNGPPRGIPSCGYRWGNDDYLDRLMVERTAFITPSSESKRCPRYVLGYKSGEGLDLCIAGHAERNSLINAARHGIAVKGAKMYMNCPIPCSPCLVEIINAGISEIVCTELTYYDKMAEYLIKNSEIRLRRFECI